MVRNYECYDFRFSICQEFTTVPQGHRVRTFKFIFVFTFAFVFVFCCCVPFHIIIFVVAKVVFTCEDVKSDGSRFEDGGFASVVARVRRTGVPNIVMVVFAFNYF